MRVREDLRVGVDFVGTSWRFEEEGILERRREGEVGILEIRAEVGGWLVFGWVAV